MISIPSVKAIPFFLKGEKFFFHKNLNTNFRYKIGNNIKNKKKSDSVMMHENYIDTSSNWVKKITSTRLKSKNKLIRDLNRAGKGFLKTIRLPSNNEESYKFISFDKLFLMNFSEINITTQPKISDQLDIIQNDIWIFFVNGIYVRELSSVNKLPTGFYFGLFSELPESKQKNILDVANKGESGVNGGFFSALNAACLEDIVVLLVPEDSNFKKNINIVFQGEGASDNFYINQKLVIISSKNSFSKIAQYHVGKNNSKYLDNTTTSLHLHENSRIEYSFINQVPESASQITSIHVEIEKNAHFQISSAATGGFLSRLNLGIDINGINSSVKLNGITLANNEKKIGRAHV